jgi:hypothetical protein
MRRLISLLFALPFSSYLFAYPISSYVITGYVNSDINSQTATSQLKHISTGDLFTLQMSIQQTTASEYQIDLFGKLGDQEIKAGSGQAFYYGNDNGLSGLGVNTWDLSELTPKGNAEITPNGLSLALRGQELYYPYQPMPDELRIIDENGIINPKNFVEGTMWLNFFSSLDGDLGLSGVIKDIRAVAVSEPSMLSFMLMMGAFVAMRSLRSRQHRSKRIALSNE